LSYPSAVNNEALDTLLSVQALLSETIDLLNTRADLLTGEDEPDSLTEQRALLNTVKGMKSLVEIQLRAAGGIK
jgi:hypothetical protein